MTHLIIMPGYLLQTLLPLFQQNVNYQKTNIYKFSLEVFKIRTQTEVQSFSFNSLSQERQSAMTSATQSTFDHYTLFYALYLEPLYDSKQ